MRIGLTAGACLALALLIGCTDGKGEEKKGDGLKSGPQVGQGVGIFEPLSITGPFEGKRQCLVWANGPKPVVMIFAREISDPLTSLVKKVDAINKDQGKKMGSFVVMLGDDESFEKKLKDLAEKEKLDKTILTTFTKKDGPEDYDINKDADVTVICYKSKKVKANRAFKKGEFKAEDVEKIIKEDLPKIVETDK